MSRVKKRKPFGVFCYAIFAYLVLCATVFVCIKIGPKTVPWIQIMLVKNIVLVFWYWAMHMGLITYNNFSMKRKDSGVGSDENFKKNLPEVFLWRLRKHVYQCSVCHSNASFGSICLWPIFTCSFTWPKQYFHPSKRSHFMRVLWSWKRKSRQRRPEINPQVRSIEFACHSPSFNKVGFKAL